MNILHLRLEICVSQWDEHTQIRRGGVLSRRGGRIRTPDLGKTMRYIRLYILTSPVIRACSIYLIGPTGEDGLLIFLYSIEFHYKVRPLIGR